MRAGFYLDACARAKKRAGAWMDDCVGRKDFGAEHTVPVAYLVCNFLPAAPGKPALLTHDDVVTMFHEFGHGLHHMLTRVGYPSIAGINGVSWDAVELPSQFLENFAWRPEVLATMARHFETGAPLPAEQQAQLLGSRTFHAGLATMRQLEFALFDFRLHAEYDPARGARVARNPRRGARRGRRVRRARVESLPAQLRPHLRRRLRRGLLQLQVGRSAGCRCVRGVRGARRVRQRGRAAFPRFHPVAGWQPKKALDAFVDFRGRPPDVNALLRQQGLVQ